MYEPWNDQGRREESLSGADKSTSVRAAKRAMLAWACWALGSIGALTLWQHGLSLDASVWFGGALVALALAVVGKPWLGNMGVLAAVALIAAGMFSARILTVDGQDVLALLKHQGQPFVLTSPDKLERDDFDQPQRLMKIEGMVVDIPERLDAVGRLARWSRLVSITERRPNATASKRFRVKVERAATGTENGHEDKQDWVQAHGYVRVSISDASNLAIGPGDRVRVMGMAQATGPARNPGQADGRLWAQQERASVMMRVADSSLIEPLESDPFSVNAMIPSGWFQFRRWVLTRTHLVLDSLDQTDAGQLLNSLLLGEQSGQTQLLRARFAKIGLAHVLAISGFHLAILTAGLLFLTRFAGVRGRLEPVLVGLCILGYLLIVPARAPILRAGAMVLIWLGTMAMGRRYDQRALLAWIGLGLLFIRPMDAFSLGYQLTFGITAVLVWFGERFHRRLFSQTLRFERYEPADVFSRRWLVLRLSRLISASLLCWAAATPIVAERVGLVSLWAVPATLIVVPMVVVVLLVGYAGLLVGAIVPAAGPVVASVLGVGASMVLWVVEAFGSLPAATIHLPRLSIVLAAAWTVLVLWWLLKGRMHHLWLWGATLVCCVWLAAALTLTTRLPRDDVFAIDMFDVGNGTCHLLRSGDEAMLWDCGSLWPDIGVRTIPRGVRALGAWHVRRALITHPNLDHFDGLLDCVEPLGIEQVYLGQAIVDKAKAHPTGAEQALLVGLKHMGVKVDIVGRGDGIRLGEVALEIISPAKGATHTKDNDDSLVAIVHVPTQESEVRALMTGDIEHSAMEEIQTYLASQQRTLHAAILELPHHGSLKPAAKTFVQKVDPIVVLQSTGPARANTIGWNALAQGRWWWTSAWDGWAWGRVKRDGTIQTGSMRTRAIRDYD